MRLAAACALAAGCSDAAPPDSPRPLTPESAAPPPAATLRPLDYACASGETIQVAYPDVETAVVAYQGVASELVFDARATTEGATYADATWSWRTVGGAGELSVDGEVVEQCEQEER